MTIRERLRHMVDGLPDGGAITLPVAAIRAMLGEQELVAEPDFTVAEVAELFGRSPVTIRQWIRAGNLRAYLFRGREYRVPRQAVEEMLERYRKRYSTTSPRALK